MSIFSAAYAANEKFFNDIPGFAPQASLDKKLWSPRANMDRRIYSPGIALALAKFLTGEFKIQSSEKELWIEICEKIRDGRNQSLTIRAAHNQQEIVWSSSDQFEYQASAGAIGLASALKWPETFTDTIHRLREIINVTGFPIDSKKLKTMTKQKPELQDLIRSFTDYLYGEVTFLLGTESIHIQTEIKDEQPSYQPWSVADLQAKLQTSMPNESSTELINDKLERLVKRGGAALMVGPPGTFKTTMARKLAVKLGTHIVEVRGSPGLEDRDLFGMYIKNEQGQLEWIDGPLPQVFSLAREKNTVALVDEVLRFLPETTNVFITLLNELDYEDCVLLLKPALLAAGVTLSQLPAKLQLYLPEEHERYYMLTLPNGQSLFALKKRITWVFTTNWGEDHLQVASNLDAALESRIEMLIEVERADREVTFPIYQQLAGPWPDLAAFAIELEDESHHQMADTEGLFRRALDPRKMIAFLKDARSLMDEGKSFKTAVLRAAEHTIIPHICPRESNGLLERASIERANEIIEKELLPLFKGDHV